MRYVINWIGEIVLSQFRQHCLICGGEIAANEKVYDGVMVWTVGDYGSASRFVCSHLEHGKPETGRYEDDHGSLH